MNKLVKILSTFLVVFISVLGLAACNEKYDFYEDFYTAGATNLTKDHIFEVITLDDAKKMKEDKESFVVFLGLSKYSEDVAAVNAIAYDAENLNYDGKVYFINLDDFKTVSSKSELNETLNIKYDSVSGIIAVCYDKGELLFETTRPTKYEECSLFNIHGTDDNPIMDIHALATYTFENYPVKKFN